MTSSTWRSLCFSGVCPTGKSGWTGSPGAARKR